jgi:hypothetical protein
MTALRLEVAVIPVSDVDSAKAFYQVFHDVGGVFYHAGTEGRAPGPDPQGRSYSSWASFSDPDGNRWMLQEIVTRLPGREWDEEA